MCIGGLKKEILCVDLKATTKEKTQTVRKFEAIKALKILAGSPCRFLLKIHSNNNR